MSLFIPQYKSLVPYFPKPGTTGHLPTLAAFVQGRDGHCAVPGCDYHQGTPPHHGVLRRSDVQGWDRRLRCLIDTPYCVLQLCVLHHETALEPSREEVANWMWLRYGPDFVRWLRWLPYKVHPLRGWLGHHVPV